MHTLSHYYNDPRIFKNALYGFIISVAGTAALYAFLFAIFVASVFSAAARSSTSLFSPVGFIVVIMGLLAGAIAVAIVAAILYKRAFDKLAEKSGVRSFSTAGELILIGTALTIVFVGAIIAWIAWIYALSGFNSLKPKGAELPTVSYLPPEPLSKMAFGDKRYCIYCGQVISVDSDYCPYCGKRQK